MDIRESYLEAKFVQDDYFLCRIKDFEYMYGRDWGTFLADFKTGKFSPTENRYADFTEWAFLCTTFMSELIAHEGTDPPKSETLDWMNYQKPESDSGFWFIQ